MVKLSDILGTRYIYDDYASKLLTVFKQYDEVDLAGCKFTPKAESALRTFYGKVYFINSEEDQLNAILQHNNIAKVSRMEGATKLEMDFNDVGEFKRFLAGLDKHGHYFVERALGDFDMKPIATLTILAMMFPQMIIDVGKDLSNIFNFARYEWLKCSKKHDEYWLVDNNALIKIQVDDGYVRMLDGRVIKEDAFIQMFNVMPVDFGTRVIIKDEEFRPIFQNSLEVLDEKRERQHIMLDFLERRDSYE